MQVAPKSSPAISAKRDRDVAAALPSGGCVGKAKLDGGRSSDTSIVGDSEMSIVGDSDATGVGATVAPGIVGPREGAEVGAVGRSDGFSEGVSLGPSLGASVEPEGSPLGLSEGRMVGSPFARALQVGRRAFTQKGIN
jgi:hypothetical protein